MEQQSLFDIDEIVHALFCCIDNMTIMTVLSVLNKRCYTIYFHLTTNDIRNKIVRKYWTENIHRTRFRYNYLIHNNRLQYVTGREHAHKYLNNLCANDAEKAKLIATISSFIFNKDCKRLCINGVACSGKTYLKEVIVLLLGYKRINSWYDHDSTLQIMEETDYLTVCWKTPEAYLNNQQTMMYSVDISTYHKYLFEDAIHVALDSGVILLNNQLQDNWVFVNQQAILNELFSLLIDGK